MGKMKRMYEDYQEEMQATGQSDDINGFEAWLRNKDYAGYDEWLDAFNPPTDKEIDDMADKMMTKEEKLAELKAEFDRLMEEGSFNGRMIEEFEHRYNTIQRGE